MIYAPNPLVDHGEGSDLQRRHCRHERRAIAGHMHGQERRFDEYGAARQLAQILKVTEMQSKTLGQKQQRKEIDSLVLRHPRSAGPQAPFICPEHDDAVADIGIESGIVRMRVVFPVPFVPPAMADPGREIEVEVAQHIVRASRSADLTMARVVADHRHLAGDNRQIGGDRHLPPRVARRSEQQHPQSEGQEIRTDPADVVASARLEQTRLPDQRAQLPVGAPGNGRWRCFVSHRSPPRRGRPG